MAARIESFREAKLNGTVPSFRARSKQLKDRDHEKRRQERLQLFGYVKLKNGESITVDEAIVRIKAGFTENPNKRVLPILQSDIIEWHVPERFQDAVNSIGEVDALNNYPALQIERGDVLRDSKLRPRYSHPSLERE